MVSLMGTFETIKEGGSMKILVVDDDELNQRLLNIVLAGNSNAIVFAHNGYEAIKIIDQEHFDLIFMDIQIPRIDGFEVCQYLRNSETANQQVPIIVLTALSSHDEKLQHYLEEGLIDECIHKPFDVSQIKKILASVANKEKIKLPAASIRDNSNSGEVLVLDIEKVLPIFGNDMEKYNELFDDFLNALPERIKKMRQSEQKSDWTNLSVLAHNLTGIARNFGADQLSVLAIQLDERSKQADAREAHRLLDEITENISVLVRAFDSVSKKATL